MLGWTLFLRAITMLVEDLPTAVRLSAVPYGAAVALDLWIASRWPGVAFEPGGSVPPSFAMASLMTSLFKIAVTLWIAVAWHRYILIAERSEGWIPPRHRRETADYLFRSIGISLIVVAAVLMIRIFVAPFAVLFGAELVVSIAPLIGLFVGGALFYRLGLVLPAAALGKALSFGEAWRRTDGQGVTVGGLALLSLAGGQLFNLPILLDGGETVITPVYRGAVGWISMMLGASILTVYYGHLIEGRSID